MNDPHKDDCYDEQLSRIYQQSRIEEPPMALDSAILTQARKAVEAPAKIALWKRMRWMIPLASTVIVLLTASLFIQMKAEHPESITQDLIMDAAPMKEQREIVEQVEDMIRKKVPAPAKEAVGNKNAGAVKAMQGTSLQAPILDAIPAPKSSAPVEKQSLPAPAKLYKSARPPVQTDAVTSDFFEKMMGDVEPEAQRSVTGLAAPMPVEVWLKQIRTLIRNGKLDEADISMQGFRKRYPDAAIPEDIISALK